MALSKADVLIKMRKTGLVPVLRAETEQQATALAEMIVAGGIDILELTLTTPGALSLLRQLARQYPNLLLGVGTVLDPETARISILEGAQFVVSPALNMRTIELCQRYSIAVLPGALTPTEIVSAWQAGADVIKVFPANAMGGASYLRSIKGPLPQVQMIPTGGISLATARDFLDAGAMALGVGTDLVDSRAISSGDQESVKRKAGQYLQIVKQYQLSLEG